VNLLSKIISYITRPILKLSDDLFNKHMFARRSSLFVSLFLLVLITVAVLEKVDVINEFAADILKTIVIGCFSILGYYHYRKGKEFEFRIHDNDKNENRDGYDYYRRNRIDD
jgi:hypothetical protein